MATVDMERLFDRVTDAYKGEAAERLEGFDEWIEELLDWMSRDTRDGLGDCLDSKELRQEEFIQELAKARDIIAEQFNLPMMHNKALG